MAFFRGKRVLVTGGTGFVGSHLVEKLLDEGARVRTCGRDRARLALALAERATEVEFLEGDLSDSQFAQGACEDEEMVFHLAAKAAGVGYNASHPATILHENAVVNLALLEGATRSKVDRVLLTSTACEYPRESGIPTTEADGFKGDPEHTNFGYGWSKRFLEVQGRACA